MHQHIRQKFALFGSLIMRTAGWSAFRTRIADAQCPTSAQRGGCELRSSLACPLIGRKPASVNWRVFVLMPAVSSSSAGGLHDTDLCKHREHIEIVRNALELA